MNKRQFLQALLASGSVALVSSRLLQRNLQAERNFTALRPDGPPPALEPVVIETPSGLIVEPYQNEIVLVEENIFEDGFQHSERAPDISMLDDEEVDDYLYRIRNFDADFPTDIILPEAKRPLLLSTVDRLERAQSYVGHGNFNLLGYDELLFFARNYEAIGAFTDAELAFIDEIFHADATAYGFFGAKVTPELTNRIAVRDVLKIPHSGHWLLKGESNNLYEQIRKDVGSNLLLTSGVRNIVKQIHLFLAKARESDFNMSRASRSLAPPGHSFHCIGDFDVGTIGLGARNFTNDFSETEEFRRMVSLGYIDIRYPDDNPFGVRFEPWHVKLGS